MAAVLEGQSRGSLTSLPELLDRASRLHEVLSTGRTASILDTGRSGFPGVGRDTQRRLEENRSQRIISLDTTNYSDEKYTKEKCLGE